MRSVKLIGLAVVAAMALVALAGSGSALATATALCKSNSDSPLCSSGNTYAAGTSIEAQSSDTKIQLAEGHSVSCSESDLTGKTNAQYGTPLRVSLSWALDGCILAAPGEEDHACTADTYSDGGADVFFSHTSGSNGTAAFSGLYFLELVCPGSATMPECSMFYSEAPTGQVTGGSAATIGISNAQLEEFWTIYPPCESSTLSATFTITTPQPLYPAKPGFEKGARLCKVAECDNSLLYPSGTTIEAEAPNLKVGDITCGKSTLTAKTQALSGNPLPLGGVKIALNECFYAGAGGCTASFSETTGGITTASTLLLDAKATWDFLCGTGPVKIHCVFDSVGLEAAATSTSGGNPATIKYGEQMMNRTSASNVWCPSVNKLTVNYTVNSPKPLYFAK